MKGQYGKACNRTVCDNEPAIFFNHSTRKYYCHTCAVLLNYENRIDAIKLYGHDLCTLSDKFNQDETK